MNTDQQVAAVKNIIKIKNKILHSSDWNEIAALMQDAINISTPVAANEEVDSLDRTMTKEWNIISIKRLMKAVQEKNFASLETAYPEVAASLLRLSMIFVKGGLPEVNKILAADLFNKGIYQPKAQQSLRSRS